MHEKSIKEFKHYNNACEWAEAERMFEGKPFRYYRLEPWIPFSCDNHENRLVVKPRQIIWSEHGANEVFHYLRENPYRSALHTFHRDKKGAEDFSRERYAKAIRNCNELMRCEKSKNLQARSFMFREGDEQFIYIIGTKKTETEGVAGAGALGKSPGMILYDERQDQDLEVKTYVGMSLGFKHDAKSLTGGTPRTPGNPLTLEYNSSDQKVLLYKCPKCKTWFRPEINLEGRQWFCDNLKKLDESISDEWGKPQNYIMICHKCGHNMDHCRGRYGQLDDGSKIRWVSQELDNNEKPRLTHYSGYRFSRFDIGLWPPDKLIADITSPSKTLREIYNDVLGLEFAGEDCPYPAEKLNLCKWRNISLDEARRLNFEIIVAGIDWGSAPGTYVYVEGILSDGRSVALGWTCIQGVGTKHGELVAEWLKPYSPDFILADMGHSDGKEQDLIKIFGRKRVFLVEYKTHYAKTYEAAKKIDIQRARKENVISVDRNFVIEQLSRNMADGTNYWIIPYKHEETINPYLVMFHNIFRVDPETQKTISMIEVRTTQYRYDRSGPDHTAHCKIYCSLVQHPDLRPIFDKKIRIVTL